MYLQKFQYAVHLTCATQSKFRGKWSSFDPSNKSWEFEFFPHSKFEILNSVKFHEVRLLWLCSSPFLPSVYQILQFLGQSYSLYSMLKYWRNLCLEIRKIEKAHCSHFNPPLTGNRGGDQTPCRPAGHACRGYGSDEAENHPSVLHLLPAALLLSLPHFSDFFFLHPQARTPPFLFNEKSSAAPSLTHRATTGNRSPSSPSPFCPNSRRLSLPQSPGSKPSSSPVPCRRLCSGERFPGASLLPRRRRLAYELPHHVVYLLRPSTNPLSLPIPLSACASVVATAAAVRAASVAVIVLPMPHCCLAATRRPWRRARRGSGCAPTSRRRPARARAG